MVRSRAAATPGQTRRDIIVLATAGNVIQTHVRITVLWIPRRPEQALGYCVHFTASPPLAVSGQAVVSLILCPMTRRYPSGTRSILGLSKLEKPCLVGSPWYCRGIVLQRSCPHRPRDAGEDIHHLQLLLSTIEGRQNLWKLLGTTLSGPVPPSPPSPQLRPIDQHHLHDQGPDSSLGAAAPAVLPLPHCFGGPRTSLRTLNQSPATSLLRPRPLDYRPTWRGFARPLHPIIYQGYSTRFSCCRISIYIYYHSTIKISISDLRWRSRVGRPSFARSCP